VLEALVMGVLASIVGPVPRLGLAKGLFSLFDAVGFTLPNNGILLETRTVIVSLALGIVVTLIASFFPALRATRVPPIAAVREGASCRPAASTASARRSRRCSPRSASGSSCSACSRTGRRRC
jgi:putative ABC transport system permease protein